MDSMSALWYYLLKTMAIANDLIFLHSRHEPDCRARVDKHFDGYYTLQFIERGGGAVEVWYGDARYGLDARDGAWFWPAYPGPRIRFHAAPGYALWQHRYAAFQGPRVARWIADGMWPTRPLPAPDADGCRARFDALLNLLERATTGTWRTARAVNLLEAFLLELAEAGAAEAKPAPAEPWLDTALTALAGNDNGEEVSPEDFVADYAALARGLGMAPSTLRRRFRDAVGVPLHEFALQRRVARARTLLGATDLPIKVIADRLGYADVYFFTRQFRQRTGVTPAAYRRSRQA
jgi:AraC-like DNA-binding protein